MDYEEYPKVLFVDDELNILNTIKRSFLRKPFKVFIVDSGEKGLELLKLEKIDIVVSDVKMPEMDGIEFLTKVKELYPHMNRLILSGYVEKEAVVNAIISGIAFNYMTKPWENDELVSRLTHIIEIKKIIKNEKVIKLINKIEKLPDTPELYEKFIEAVRKGASMGEIAEIISKNLSLTTKILQVVNSAFYSTTKISSIHVAVSLLGLNNLKNIIFSTILLDEKELTNKERRELIKISKISFKVNKLLNKLYTLKYKERLMDDYTSLGLTYNIGKIIMIKYFSEEYFKIIEEMRKDISVDFYKKEIELFIDGTTHCELGAYFLDIWNFSDINITAALYKMKLEILSENDKKVIELLDLSDNIINYFEHNRIEEFYRLDEFKKFDIEKEIINEILERLGE